LACQCLLWGLDLPCIDAGQIHHEFVSSDATEPKKNSDHFSGLIFTSQVI
jgi:hypothetical protein